MKQLSNKQKAGAATGIVAGIYAGIVGWRYYNQRDRPDWTLILMPIPQSWTKSLIATDVDNYVSVVESIPTNQRELYMGVMRAWYPSARDFMFAPVETNPNAETMEARVDPKELEPPHERFCRRVVAYNETHARTLVMDKNPNAYDLAFLIEREQIDGIKNEYRAVYKIRK